MEFIAHRINTLAELKDLPEGLGLELDLRDRVGERLILQHDPYKEGEDFETFLSHYVNRGTLILNIKSERIEWKVLELIQKYNINKYFFLDSSFPMIYQLTSKGEKNIALRFSEFEGLDTIQNMQGKASWVWVDCFTLFPLTKKIEEELHSLGYKICLVSPELQGREEDISKYKDYIQKENIHIDAVCSKLKNYNKWMKFSPHSHHI